MGYIFRGNLSGLICDECPEPVSRVTLRFYQGRNPGDEPERVAANPKNTFAILTDAQSKESERYLFATTETDAEGNFKIDFPDTYNGSAFEIDLYMERAPGRDAQAKNAKPVHATLTTLQPDWRQTERDVIGDWDYVIPFRFWCGLLALFGVYTICGRVVVQGTNTPVGGVRVLAFDADWIQDDLLGDQVTDASGEFRIMFTADVFNRTPLSFLGINLDTPLPPLSSGPDLYFRVETLSGTSLLTEPKTRGLQPDRENAGSCTCIVLQIPKGDGDGGKEEEISAFYAIGGYDFPSDGPATASIDSALTGTGKTMSGHAFFSNLRLNGNMQQTRNGNPVEYLFRVAEWGGADGTVAPLAAAFVPVALTQVAKTRIGTWEKFAPTDPSDPNPIKTEPYWVNGDPMTERTAAITPDGWIRVPQETGVFSAGGNFHANGDFISLISTSLTAFGSRDMTGRVAGQSTVTPAQSATKNRFFAVRMYVRETGSAAEVLAGACERLAVYNTVYNNVGQGGAWAPGTESDVLGVAMVNILQLTGGGCTPISNALDVVYTGANPNLGGISISMAGPGGPYGFTIPAPVAPASATDNFGTAVPSFSVGALSKCAYVVTLSATLLLTTGDSNHDNLHDVVAFCK